MIILDIVRLLVAIALALVAGKLISKLRLPAILGWLIVGMILGPHAVGLLSNDILYAGWFEFIESVLECTVGLMIGTELLWNQMKKAGKQIGNRQDHDQLAGRGNDQTVHPISKSLENGTYNDTVPRKQEA